MLLLLSRGARSRIINDPRGPLVLVRLHLLLSVVFGVVVRYDNAKGRRGSVPEIEPNDGRSQHLCLARSVSSCFVDGDEDQEETVVVPVM